MSVDVLMSADEIGSARVEMDRRGVSCLSSWWKHAMKKRGWGPRGVVVGDHKKSWDVLKTLEFLERHVSKDGMVLDSGCYESEVLCSLHRLGYSKLYGVDMNPAIQRMPFADDIDYRVADFMHTPFADASFQAVVSISAIEHGFDAPLLLKEVSRLLAPGGYFIASFDYWPEKVDTTNVRLFGMDWRIFSAEEVTSFLDVARTFGLHPIGAIKLAARDRPIDCMERKYTFGWLALRKPER